MNDLRQPAPGWQPVAQKRNDAYPTRDEQNRVADLMTAALAELGYKVHKHWSDRHHRYQMTGALVPADVAAKARAVAFTSLRWDFDWVDPDKYRSIDMTSTRPDVDLDNREAQP